MASNYFNPINILNTSNAQGLGSGGSLNVGGGISIGGDTYIGGKVSISGTTTSFADNILVLNENPTSSVDTGILLQRFSQDVSNGNNYSGIIYSETTDEFRFGYVQNDTKGSVTINSFTPIRTGGVTVTGGSLNATFDSNTIGSIITTGGNIGIGTTSPVHKLDVNGTLRADTLNATTLVSSANISANLITGGTARITNVIATGLTTATLLATGPGGLGSNGSVFITGSDSYGHSLHIASSTGTQKRLVFNHNGTIGNLFAFDYGAAAAQNLILQFPGGNIGIGGTSPAYKLDVTGTLRATGGDITVGTLLATTSISSASIQGTNSTITNMVNTNLSTGTLNVTGTGKISTSLTTGALYSTNQTSINIVATNISTATLNLSIGLTTSSLKTQNLIAENASIGSLFVTFGNVGIGTLAPSYRLDVEGTTRITSGGLLVSDITTGTLRANVINLSNPDGLTAINMTATEGNYFQYAIATAPGQWSQHSNLGDGIIRTNHKNLIFQSGTHGSHIFLTSSGNIGISNSNPGYKLDVNGNLNFTGNLYQNDVLYAGSSQWVSGTGGNLFYTNGNVGIGTTAPKTGYKLDVAGSINVGASGSLYQDINLDTDGGGIVFFGGAKIFKQYNDGLYIVPNNDTNGIQFRNASNNSTAMRIFGDGTLIVTNIVSAANMASNIITTGTILATTNISTTYTGGSMQLSGGITSANLEVNGLGDIINLTATRATINSLNATNSTITNAVITNISTATLNLSTGLTTGTILATTSISTGLLNATNSTITNAVRTNISSTTLNLSTGLTTGTILATTSISTGLLNATNSTITNAVRTNISSTTLNLSTGLTTGTILATTSISTGLLNATNSTITNAVITNISSTTLNLSTGLTTGTILATTNISSASILGLNSTITNLVATNLSTNSLIVTSGGLVATFNSNTIGSIFTTGGNVGINTTSPNSRLTILANTPYTNIESSSSGLQILSSSSFATTSLYMGADATNDISWIQTSRNGVFNNLILNPRGGRVGVVTSAPSATLDINGTLRATTSITSGALFITGGITTSTLLATTSISTGLLNATNSTITNAVRTNISTATLNLSTGLTTGTILATTSISTGLLNATNIAITNITGTNIIATNISSGTLRLNSTEITLGYKAGQTLQNLFAVAIGNQSGNTSQGSGAIAMGNYAGETRQGGGAVALGYVSGQYYQGANSVAIGNQAGQYTQGSTAVAIGNNAADTLQGDDAVAIGKYTGQKSQGVNGVAMGTNAGRNSQGINSIAIGAYAGENSQSTGSVSMGLNAGQNSQGSNAIAMGTNAGNYFQGSDAIAIGNQTGVLYQDIYALAIGFSAGSRYQSTSAIAFGTSAGQEYQGPYTVAIGQQAGYSNQKMHSIAIGENAGNDNQERYSVAIGSKAGFSYQKIGAIAIGQGAASTQQGNYSIAIGTSAGNMSQGSSSIAIGEGAGQESQGSYAVAIGSGAGTLNQHANSIILNASSTALNSSTSGAFYVNPIRNATAGNFLGYNTTTKEITYWSSPYQIGDFVPRQVDSSFLELNGQVVSQASYANLYTTLGHNPEITFNAKYLGRTLQTNTNLTSVATFGRQNIAKNGDTIIAVGTNSAVFRSTDNGVTWNLPSYFTAATNSQLNVIRYCGGTWNRWIVGGPTTLQADSLDNGVTWIPRAASGNYTKFAFDFNSTDSVGIFVGATGSIYRSTNATTWTQITTGSAVNIRDIAYADIGGTKTWAAVGDSSFLYGSTNNGVSFTAGNVTSGSVQFNVVKYVGGSINLFLAGGNTNNLWTSPDGLNWTSRTGVTGNVQDIEIDDTNSYIVAATSSGVARSTDGTTWTYSALASIQSVSYDPTNTTFLAVGTYRNFYTTIATFGTWVEPTTTFNRVARSSIVINGGGKILYTTDAGGILNFNTNSKSESILLSPGFNITDVTYGNGTYVALSSDAFSSCYTSTDGNTWTYRKYNTAVAQVGFGGRRIKYVNDTFIILSTSTIIFTSPDGITWTQRTTPNTTKNDVIWTGTNYVICTSDNAQFLYSSNLSTWIAVTPIGASNYGTGIIIEDLTHIGSGVVIGVARSGFIYKSTDHGVTWSIKRVPDISTYDFCSVAYSPSDNVIVAVTRTTNQIAYSSDGGDTWQSYITVTSQAAVQLSGVIHGNGDFITFGRNSLIGVSPDGATWEWTSPGGDFEIIDMIYGDGVFVGAGLLNSTTIWSTPIVVYSTDGKNWTIKATPHSMVNSGFPRQRIGYGNRKFIIPCSVNLIAAHVFIGELEYDPSTEFQLPVKYIGSGSKKMWVKANN